MRRFAFAACIALCSILANGCFNGISRATAANVLSVTGKVLFGSAGRGDFEPLTRKSRIHNGDIVQSFVGGSVDLELVPGVLARLSPDSEITIEELKIVKDGNETSEDMHGRSARIRLNRGKTFIMFNRPVTGISTVAVAAQEVTVTPDSNCLFSVWSDGKASRVTCARGNVNAAAATQPQVTIAAGFFVQWPAANPKPLQAAVNAAAQVDAMELIGSGERLLRQAIDAQNRRPL